MKGYVSVLGEIAHKDLAQVGGKGANLGEMIRAGFSVPPGFSVRSLTHERFLDAHNLRKPIEEMAANIDFLDLGDVEKKTARIREMISAAQVPDDIAEQISEAYETLREDSDLSLVAVRSSVGTKDLARSSFPGQMDTFHNVRGNGQVLASIRRCWASVWSSRSASTLYTLGIDPCNIIIAPVVQRMVPSEVAGVLFTANPIN